MSIIKGSDGKILVSSSGGVKVDSGGNNTKILHIDTDLQQPNRIFKDSSNNVSQITDKVNNLPFFINQNDNPLYDYNEHFYFDGVDDGVETPITDIGNFGANDFAISFWIAFNDLNDNGIRAIFNRTGSSNTWLIRERYSGSKFIDYYFYTSGGNLEKTISYVDDTNFHHVLIERDGNYIKSYYDGELTDFGNIGSQTINSYTDQILTLGSYKNGFFCGFKLKCLSIYNNALIKGTVANEIYFNPQIFKPFNWLKRYREDGYKKFFASSRYLKDATIDSSNLIGALYSEIGTTRSVNATDQPVWSQKNGLICTGSKNLLFPGSITDITPFQWTNNDFYWGMWFNILNKTSVSYKHFYQYKSTGLGWYVSFIYNNNTGGLVADSCYFNFATNPSSADHSFYFTGSIENGKWHYINVIRIGDNFYAFLDGILKISNSFSTNYSIGLGSSNLVADYSINSTRCLDYIDDMLISIGDSIINPAGFSVGDKVFEPPRRRSLDSEIIQF